MTPFEILKRFQANHADIVRDMKNANHNYSPRDLNPYHLEGDVWTHTMMVFNYAVQKNFPLEVLLAALFHDIGKSYTLTTKIKPTSSFDVYTSFHGHDGVSFYRCLDVMKKTYADVLTKSQISTISKLVANHSMLYSWQNNTKQSKEEWVKSAFAGESDFLTLLSNLVESDAMGRIAENPSRPEDFRIYRDFVTYQEKISEEKPKLTMLIGTLASGKSTWVEKNVDDEVVVISSDDILMELGSSDSYDENWKNVDFAQVESIMMKKFHDAVKNNKDIVIDRTNMSKKSRRKFLNPIRGKYETFAIVFETGHNEMIYRNVNRSSVIEKTIPSKVQFNMEKSFIYPLLDEFDFVN